MKVNIDWKQNMQFETKTPSGHSLTLDAGTEVGGQDQGPRPTEVLLAAMGTCSGIDIVDILKKMRLDVESFHMEVEGDRQAEHPRKFTQIRVNYQLKGDLPVEKVRRAVRLSLDKYCSVSQSLNAEILASFEINGQRYSAELT